MHLLQYVLPQKFTSDTIKSCFGWYYQANGGKFFILIKQVLKNEKKLHTEHFLATMVFLKHQNQTHKKEFLKKIDIANEQTMKLLGYWNFSNQYQLNYQKMILCLWVH